MQDQNTEADAVIAALHSRISVSELVAPAPSPVQRDIIFRAALRAPDHGQLRPWRFLLVEGDDRIRVGNILAEVEGSENEVQRNRTAGRLLRAPLVLLIVAHITPHTKIPEVEQIMSTAAAVQNMLLAAYTLGVGAMWRSGMITYEPLLAEKLGLAADERLLGFLYLGTPKNETKKIVQTLDVNDFFTIWQAP